MTLPSTVKIVEVGPRDGLQNEQQTIPTQTKVEFINRLSHTGLQHIEATSFVARKWIPQLADAEAVMQNIERTPGVTYSALTPNLEGFSRALATQTDQIAVFTAASDAFTQKNINCSIDESIKRFAPVISKAQEANIPVRAYISCVLGCPYSGDVTPTTVAQICHTLYDMGCYEISLGDTIGIGTPKQVQAVIDCVEKNIPLSALAVHFHDTYGQALVNIYAALQAGIHVIDAATAGLGGCPYAQGASGNVATEDVIYLLDGLGIKTGVDLKQLTSVAHYISDKLGKLPQSKVARARG